MKYLTFFTTDAYKDRQLATAPPAVTKSTYMAQLLRDIGQSVEIISPSWSKCHAWHHWKASDSTMDNQVKVHQLATFSTPFRWLTPLQWLYSLGQLFFYLIRHTHAGEPVLVYHSYYLSFPVLLAKRIKKFKLILEVEEIYQDIIHLPKIIAALETRILNTADGYVLSADDMRQALPCSAKPWMIINGIYTVEAPRNAPPFSDGKIHCVYAGTLDPAKGGAYAAVEVAAFLPENYHLHILGFGSEQEKSSLLKQIQQVQLQSPCGLSYEGAMQGENYIRFLQRCQIGLSTQIPEGQYIKTSFPSKILVYLSNALQVVSARIPSVVHSGVGDLITYYDAQTPEQIAAAIRAIDVTSACNPTGRLQELHKQSCTRLQKILEALS